MNLKTIHGCYLTVLLLIFAAAIPISHAQDGPAPAAKPVGPTVTLSLIVTDSAKKSVKSIRKEDVRVIEDKVEQTILSIEPDDRPVDCAILIDASGSMGVSLMMPSLELAKQIILNKRPEDHFFIARFISSDKIEKVQDFTGDGRKLLKALEAIYIEAGQSAVIDAVYVGADEVAKHNAKNDGRRKLLILMSDGEDRNSYYTVDQLTKFLRERGVQVFAVGLTSELTPKKGSLRNVPLEKAEELLTRLADETGGRAFFDRNKKELADITTQIVNDLHSQFRVTFQPSSDKQGFRQVEVSLSSPAGQELHPIAPRGYYVNTKGGKTKPTERK